METTIGVEIDTATLRTWLESGEPVEVVDIRPRTDYEAWHIPGSRNVDAYKAIFANSPGPLADYDAPVDRSVVAVCFVGQTSLAAAHYLRSRGIPALSLAGGMQGWSSAWNTAEVPSHNSRTRVVQVRRTGKGCLSYVIASGGEALVIDASVDPGVYLDLAAENGWRITRVLDTHIHADHLSRSQALAAMTGSRHDLPQQNRAHFDHTPITDGDEITMGVVNLLAMHTPGHTFESMSFLLDGEILFTGDTLFLDSVGRPDLNAGQSETEARARALHRTLQELASLNPETLILPGHTGKPVAFDQVPIAAPLQAVIENIDALGYGEDAFVNWITGRIPPNPPNYEKIVRFNEAGRMPEIALSQLEAGANRCAV